MTQRGYRRDGDGYLVRSLPSVEFGYTPALLHAEVREVDPDSVANLPAGLGATGHQWADLDGEGIPGVLVSDADSWRYKPNLGEGRLGPLQPVPGAAGAGRRRPGPPTAARPRRERPARRGHARPGRPRATSSRTAEGGWLPWQPFAALPTVDFDAPDVRLVDLDGDGHADLLVTEGESLTWYPSRGRGGLRPGDHACPPRSTPMPARGSSSPTVPSRSIWPTCRATACPTWCAFATARSATGRTSDTAGSGRR